MFALDFQKFASARCSDSLAINDNAAFSCTALDAGGLGAKEVHLFMRFGAMDIAMAVLKLQESNTLTNSTTLASATDVTGGDFSVSPATLPSATDDNHGFCISIPMTGSRKRYLNLAATAGDGSAGTYFFACWLYIPDNVPNTAALRGLTQHLIIPG